MLPASLSARVAPVDEYHPWIKPPFISPSGWNKTSLSLDASEERDGYSSAEDPLQSDAEDDAGKKLVRSPSLAGQSWGPDPWFEPMVLVARQCAGKYTVKADYEKAGAQELTVKSGETVELLKQDDDGLWWGTGLTETQGGWK